jgi:hypothetical protein
MSTLIQSVATIAAAIGAVKTTRWYVAHETQRSAEKKQQAFNLYVETGTKNQTFYLLDRGVAKTAERQRVRVIRKRCKEKQEFTSLCECPQCFAFDMHSIVHIRFRYCFRECKECKYVWRQK